MAVFKCKMCGAELNIEEGASVAVCDYCGTKQTLPKLTDERRANLYDRANHFRRNNEFDKAAGIYEQILNENTADAEAYWSLVLCRYGIEYVEDPATKKRIPTVNRAQFTSIYADEDYRSALKNADAQQREIYEAEAKQIDAIQRGILAISQKEEPFDVFICYKETDENGRRTYDSVLANDLYHQLTQEGFKVFFARITLEDKLGTAYEPYIFAALNSAKVMVVLGTKPEYFNAVWVKNEWSRYLALVKESGGKKTLIPAYRDMDPYDLPEEFSHLQAQDMSKLGFMQDLIRGIRKLTVQTEKKRTERETPIVVQSEGGNMNAILDRGFFALEDGDFAKADGFFEQALNFDARSAQAYLGKLMAEKKIRRREDLRVAARSFDDSANYQKALRFSDEKLKKELTEAVSFIRERNENARLQGIYDNALAAMDQNTEEGFGSAAELFASIPGFKDADELARTCPEKAEYCRKDAIYAEARRFFDQNTEDGCSRAAKLLSSIPGFKDADEIREGCVAKTELLRKEKIYKKAHWLFARNTEEECLQAERLFRAVSGYKDADRLAKICALKAEFARKDELYGAAKKKMEGGTVDDYAEASKLFARIPGHRDADEKQAECRRILDEREKEEKKTNKRIAAVVAISVTAAILVLILLVLTFTVFVPNAKYNDAVKLYNNGQYEEAIAGFKALNGYRNSESYLEFEFEKLSNGKYQITKYKGTGGDVVIPQGVTSIGYQAFRYCTKLTSVTIPNSVTSIGDYAFYGCTSLKTVNYRGTAEQWKQIRIDSYNDPLNNAKKVYNYTGE